MMILETKFVEFVPSELEEGFLYISVEYGTVVHLCACGCGNKVVTPLTPTDWKMTYDGETVSLNPSVGSWNLLCKSHYWIEANEVVWAESWSNEQIEAGRNAEKLAKIDHYGESVQKSPSEEKQQGWWSRIKSWFQ